MANQEERASPKRMMCDDDNDSDWIDTTHPPTHTPHAHRYGGQYQENEALCGLALVVAACSPSEEERL